jgi:hypothetical protein
VYLLVNVWNWRFLGCRKTFINLPPVQEFLEVELYILLNAIDQQNLQPILYLMVFMRTL